MKRTQRAARTLALVVGSACVALGCAASKAPTTTTAASDDEPAASLLEHHRHHHHGGMTLLLAMSLDTLGVSTEQAAAIEAIRADLHARMETARGAERRLLGALADGLDAPEVDANAVNADVASAAAAVAAVHDASVTALGALHAALTPAQRAALVDKLEAHWAVWRSANGAEPGPADGRDGRLSMLTDGLELSTAQVTAIRAKLRESGPGGPRFDADEVSSNLHAFGEAFRRDAFDAGALAGARAANAALGEWGAARMARFVAAARPVLTPEQRAALGERLREHAAHDPSAAGAP